MVSISIAARRVNADRQASRMRRVALILALIGAIEGCATSPTLVGSIVPPLPAGTQNGQGNCFGTASTVSTCAQGISVLTDSDSRPLIIYAWNSAQRDVTSKLSVLVTDELPFPVLQDKLFLERGVCRDNAVDDETIMAVVAEAKDEWLRARAWAYKVDLPSGKFKKLDPSRIECYNTAREAD